MATKKTTTTTMDNTENMNTEATAEVTKAPAKKRTTTKSAAAKTTTAKTTTKASAKSTTSASKATGSGKSANTSGTKSAAAKTGTGTAKTSTSKSTTTRKKATKSAVTEQAETLTQEVPVVAETPVVVEVATSEPGTSTDVVTALTQKEVVVETVKETVSVMSEQDVKELVALLKDIKSANEAELKYVRRQSRFALLSSMLALFVVLALVIVGLMSAPKIIKVANEVDSILVKTNAIVDDVDNMMDDIESVMTNLTTVSDNLVKADLPAMLDNVNNLVVESEESIAQAMEKIESMDIKSLNNAIVDLGKIVGPLAKLFGK